MATFLVFAVLSAFIMVVLAVAISSAMDELEEFLDEDNDWPGSPKL